MNEDRKHGEYKMHVANGKMVIARFYNLPDNGGSVSFSSAIPSRPDMTLKDMHQESTRAVIAFLEQTLVPTPTGPKT